MVVKFPGPLKVAISTTLQETHIPDKIFPHPETVKPPGPVGPLAYKTPDPPSPAAEHAGEGEDTITAPAPPPAKYFNVAFGPQVPEAGAICVPAPFPPAPEKQALQEPVAPPPAPPTDDACCFPGNPCGGLTGGVLPVPAAEEELKEPPPDPPGFPVD